MRGAELADQLVFRYTCAAEVWIQAELETNKGPNKIMFFFFLLTLTVALVILSKVNLLCYLQCFTVLFPISDNRHKQTHIPNNINLLHVVCYTTNFWTNNLGLARVC